MEGPFGAMENIGRFPAGMNMGRMSGRHLFFIYPTPDLCCLKAYHWRGSLDWSPCLGFYWKNWKLTADMVSTSHSWPLSYRKRVTC